MFSGVHERKLDYKGRLTIPDDLLNGADHEWHRAIAIKQTSDVRLTPDEPTRFLALYDLETWQGLLRDAQRELDPDESRLFMHTVVADASMLEVDAANRVTLPGPLLQYANIERQAVVTGIFDHVEIWNPATYEAYVEAPWTKEVAVPDIGDIARRRLRQIM